MTTTKFFSIGAGVLMVLGVLYLGNMVVRTTPQSEAGGVYQYKVVDLIPAASSGNIAAAHEKVINESVAEGWEYVETASSDVIFRKK